MKVLGLYFSNFDTLHYLCNYYGYNTISKTLV